MKRTVNIVLLLSTILMARTMWVRVYYTNDFERQALLGRNFDILAGNAKKGYFEYFLDETVVNGLTQEGFGIEILHPDIITYLKATYGDSRMTFGYYYTYAEMVQELDQIVSAYPNIVQKASLGTTWQGREIWAMKISDNVIQQEAETRVLIDAVHHAREPIGCSICMDFIHYLVDNYGINDTATTIVNNDEVWIVPVTNPDGYVFNETYDDPWGNGWRKNCRDNNGGGFDPADDGVDLNRNYGYQWGYDDIGSSPIPTAEDYRGPSAFSEPETQAHRILANADSFMYALDYHAYGNYLLYPWGYINQLTPDSLLYKAMAETMTTIIGLPNNYPYGTPYQTVGYNANGGSFDWLYGEQTEKPKCIAFSSEVGEGGFWQAASDTSIIIEQCNETRPMNIYLCYRAAIVGIEEKTQPVALSNLSVFPNPAHNKINLAFNLSEPTKIDIRLFDAAGCVVFERKQIELSTGANKLGFDIEKMSSGIYFMQVNTKQGLITTNKLVILRK